MKPLIRFNNGLWVAVISIGKSLLTGYGKTPKAAYDKLKDKYDRTLQ